MTVHTINYNEKWVLECLSAWERRHLGNRESLKETINSLFAGKLNDFVLESSINSLERNVVISSTENGFIYSEELFNYRKDLHMRLNNMQESYKKLQESQSISQSDREASKRLDAALYPNKKAHENKQLRLSFGINCFIEQPNFTRVMSILHSLKHNIRLTEQNALWLITEGEGKAFNTDKIKAAFNELEAKHYVDEYRKTNDLWNIVNACGHYRKCDESAKACQLIDSLSISGKIEPRLRSALNTTHGGALRDIGDYTDAIEIALEAHHLTPKNYRPCTF